MKTLKCLFVVLAILLAALPGTGFSTTATNTNDSAVQSAFMQFDQNLNGGWRTLQLQRNYQGAADAILQFMTEHSADLKTWQMGSLAFHLGHVYALMGDSTNAVHWFKKSLSYHALSNPAYVEGFIAFLQNDKQALLVDRRSIASMHPGLTRNQDLKEMDTMIRFFGEPFEAAWGALNCVGTGAKADPQWADFCRAMSRKYHAIYVEQFAAKHSR